MQPLLHVVYYTTVVHKKVPLSFLARDARSAMRGIAIISRPSVCPPSVTLMYAGHRGWTSSKLIKRIISKLTTGTSLLTAGYCHFGWLASRVCRASVCPSVCPRYKYIGAAYARGPAPRVGAHECHFGWLVGESCRVSVCPHYK